MIYIFIVIFFWVLQSSAGEIGIKKPVLKNLPSEYISVFYAFLVDNFENAERFTPKKNYFYTIKPYLSSIAGSYNLCLDIYKNRNINRIICFSSKDAQDLSRKIDALPEKIKFLSPIKKTEKYVYLKVLTFSKSFSSELKVTSQNGDILINYIQAKEFKGENVEHITVGNALINIDTVILNGAESSKIFDYILRGYRFKGILIIKTY
ncbi:hypothetical protein [Persephonella sp.]